MDRVIAARIYADMRAGQFERGRRALGMSRPMVSRYLEQMEHWAGTRLIHRSTRKLTLTSAGEKVLQKTRSLTQLADEIAGQTERAVPSGTLRVACAHFTAMQLLSPLLPEFWPVTPTAPRTGYQQPSGEPDWRAYRCRHPNHR